jgi:thiamine pyrophosphate-dependent acetolactate synthase large subunit-like protein
MKVYEAVGAAVAGEGVDVVFGLMGDGNMELLLDLTEEHGVRFVTVRHEQGAVAMADGFARASGGVGVATTTCGPALLNTATSLAVARAHGSAVVLLAGDTPGGDPGHLQNVDQEAFGRAVAGTTLTLDDPSRAAETVAAAFAAARAGRGPVVLNLPMDVQALETTLDHDAAPGTVAQPTTTTPPAVLELPDAALLDDAVRRLTGARLPVVIAGAGVVAAGAEAAVVALAEALDAPFATTLQACGVGGGHPLSLGNAGLAGDPEALALLEEADCVLAIGASLHRLTTAFGRVTADADVIRVDRDPAAARTGAGVALAGDARVVTEALVTRVHAARNAGAGETADADGRGAAARVAQVGYPFDPDHGDGTVDPRSAFVALDRVLPRDDRTLVVDAGHFISFVGPLVHVGSPADWIFPTDLGCIGQTLATAIGVAVARPGRRITVVAGDAGFLMGLAELETAGRYDLPITFFVINDAAWGQEAHVLRLKGRSEALAHVPTPDLARVAQGYGMAGFSVTTPGDLDALGDVLGAATGPVVVDVRVNPAVPNWVIESFGLVGHDITSTAVH